ncbi:FAD-dependent oxidoreductase [Pseudonocardia sp. C8]|uniref:FAD-dependent oxidoreductase n=1 Tax=Pseudonocardia sp. C8 TaxID=2762759 RepID=UPI0016434432|nr:FAD-dependent oxidoreductase [Pseudonocardia sp. C8]
MTPAPVRCAVVGLGVLGGAALLALARAGVDCVGLDAGRVGHADGASGGGETRIVRTAVAGRPEHHRLLDRSRELWAGVAGGALVPCGALTAGPATDPRVRGTVFAGRTEVLGSAAAAERWPGHRLAPGDLAVFDPRGGLLDAPRATRALVDEACRAGAVVREDVTVLGIGHRRGRVVLRTVDGETVADAAVLATGRHTPLLPGRPQGIVPRRVVLSWFPVEAPERFRPGCFPPGVHTGGPVFSAFPTVDGTTVKINYQRSQPRVPDPREAHPDVEPGYARAWAAAVAARIPGLGECPVRVESYVEAYTADRRGIVALAGAGPRVVTVGGFSGQGFSYAPAVGEVVAGVVRTGRGPGPAFAGSDALAGQLTPG